MSSVTFVSPQNAVGGWGFAPDPLAGFKGAYFKAPTSKERGGKRREGAPK